MIFAPASFSIRTIGSSLDFDFLMQGTLGGNPASIWPESARTIHTHLRAASSAAHRHCRWAAGGSEGIVGQYPIHSMA